MSVRACDVAVLGAGVIGLAVALQLRRAGIRDVVIIDHNAAAGMGSSARANGGVRAQFATRVNIEFSRYTIAELARLDDATSGLVGLRRVGYLFMTGTADGERRLRDGFALQRAAGVAVRWLEPGGVARIAPYVRTDGLRGGTFCADDGVIDPHGVVAALASACRDLDVELVLDTDVEAVDAGDGGCTVRTSRGSIRAAHAVNATGPRARQLAALAGVDVPVLPHRRNLACTEPVAGYPDAIPMLVDVDTAMLVRREAGGFLIGYSNPQEPPSTDTSFDPHYLDAIAERIPNRFPFLSDIPINERKCWAGLYPETPDHHAIVDSAPGTRRLIHCAGFGGHGIMHSLAAGRAVAELVVDGACTTFDIRPLRLGRFAERDTVVETAVL